MIVVFSKEWFAKYNKQLCWLANSFLGQFVFKFRKFGHYPENKIVRITPNSIDEFLGYKGDRIELKAHFFGRNEYALRLQKVFYPIWFLFHAWDMLIANPFKPAWNLGFDSLTVYPDASPETTSVDGRTLQYYAEGTNNTWATLIGGAGNDSGSDQTEAGFIRFISDTGTDKWRQLWRTVVLFDSSALTASATISAAVMSIYGWAKDDETSTTPDINIYTSNPAANNALANGDYDSFGTTAQCDTPITYNNWSTTGYNDFTLNATGRGNVSKTSVSKFGTRNANYDVSGTPPTWASNTASTLYGYLADNGTNKPKLVVTYTLPAVATAGFLYLMV